MPYRRTNMFSVGKVAYRASLNHQISDGSHIMVDARTTLIPHGADGEIGIRHFPYRGVDHFIRKTRKMAEGLNAAKEQPKGIGIQWRAFGELDDDALKILYYSKFFQLDPEDNGMVYDPALYKGV